MKFGCNYILSGLNNNDSRFLLSHVDQKSVTLDKLGYTKQNINSNSYLDASQRQELVPLIDSISDFVSNM